MGGAVPSRGSGHGAVVRLGVAPGNVLMSVGWDGRDGCMQTISDSVSRKGGRVQGSKTSAIGCQSRSMLLVVCEEAFD